MERAILRELGISELEALNTLLRMKVFYADSGISLL
jgi:hypothetical protein